VWPGLLQLNLDKPTKIYKSMRIKILKVKTDEGYSSTKICTQYYEKV
jgi:hypothetical protein